MISKEAINSFNQIRNIPYHISIEGEPSFDCEDKAKMLVEELTKLGFEARIRVGLFKWSNLHLPKEIEIGPHHDDCSHMFVEFKNDKGEWVFIDPTWNPELREAGFPIVRWDGQSTTRIGVKCDQILGPNESVELTKSIDYAADLEENGEFYKAFNEYCDKFLQKGRN